MTPKTGTFLFGAVVAGALAFGARAAEGDNLVRITFTASGTMNCIQLSEIAVYDFSENRLNSKMTDAGVGVEPADLEPGTYSVSRDVCANAGETWVNLFDGNGNTKLYADKDLNFSNGAQVSLAMRLKSSARPMAYDFCTANDVTGRSPTAWTVEVSLDGGQTWICADERRGFGYPNKTFTWFGGAGSRLPLNLSVGSPYLIRQLPCQHLGALAACTPVPAVVVRETGEEVADIGDLFDITYADNDRVGLASGLLTGRPGTAVAGLELPFTFAIVPEGQLEYLMRIVFKAGGSSSGTLQLSEIAVYDAERKRINLGMADAGVTSAADGLQPGQFALSRLLTCGGGEGLNNLFDGNSGTKLCATGNATLDLSDPGTWLVLTMRFADVAAIPAYYDFSTANDALDRSPRTWTVEMSDDYGRTWVEADAQADFAYPNKTHSWFGQSRPSGLPLILNYEGSFPFRVASIRKQTYYKKPVEPQLKVADKHTGQKVEEGVDYEVEYLDNDGVGTATAVVRCLGGYGPFRREFGFEIVKPGIAVIMR